MAGGEPFADRVMRAEKCEVYITGSSAQMLSQEIAPRCAAGRSPGRCSPSPSGSSSTSKESKVTALCRPKKRLTFQKAFDDYWESGGFPEVAGLDRMLRIKTHQEYLSACCFATSSSVTTSPIPRDN